MFNSSNSPSPNNHHHHHRASIFSSTPSAKSPSRQQQHQGRSATATAGGVVGAGPGVGAGGAGASPLPLIPSTSGRATLGPPAPRKSSVSTPKPVLPPLSFFRDTGSNSFALSVADAGSHPDDPPSRAAENVTVSVRVRPFSLSEMKVAGGPAEVWAVNDGLRIGYADDYSMRERRTAVDYTYDHALTGSDNEAIYNSSVKNLVQSAMEGFNGTVFAYGQTSSGKTYTMSGTSNQPGITPRAVEDVFKYIRENSEREFLLRVSYLEIYNESIRDLLSPEAIDLKIHEDRKRGVYVSPLKEEIVTTPSQVMRIIQRGDYQRHTSSTDYNAHSSRSHSIFQIVIESRERAPTAPLSPTVPTGRKMSLGLRSPPSAVRVSQLNLIDLAGSEKASSDVERRKEGAFINKSLLTLGTVIAKLTDEKGGHIPYRDSKLTRILQSSLSGNARVSVICTISPSFLNVEESHNTLKFAARVKKIITKVHTNQVMDDKALLEKYRREITELKTQLLFTAAAAAASQQDSDLGGGGGRGGGDGGRQQQLQQPDSHLSQLLERERLKHEEEMIEMNLVRNALKERIDQLTKLILTSQSINTKGAGTAISGVGLPPDGLQQSPVSSSALSGRYTVETTADGTVLEFPKEIESRLARKDTIVRQLQSELEAQQEKVTLMKTALQRTAKGEVVDIAKTLARVDMEPEREKFLIEKRASIMNLNGVAWQDGAGAGGGAGGGVGRNSGQGSVRRVMRDPYAVAAATTPAAPFSSATTTTTTTTKNDDMDDAASLLILPDGEQLPLSDGDDIYDDDDLMDTPWNRAELHSLRQAKRELEIVVIEQERKLEDMVAFEDSDEFRNLVLELEEYRERLVGMEEEREGLKAMITELRNSVRQCELSHGLENGPRNGVGAVGAEGGYMTRVPFSPPGSPSPLPSSPALSATTTTSTTTFSSTPASSIANPRVAAAANRIQELEQMVQRERKLRMEEQTRSMGRIASLEAEVTILKAEQSIHNLA
ncbi:hypothetical protein BGW39_004817 [Mortierella sp. 14UC]|nr:hypothetical protein BGW39_004817 [Mortierella sp. 14UC]